MVFFCFSFLKSFRTEEEMYWEEMSMIRVESFFVFYLFACLFNFG